MTTANAPLTARDLCFRYAPDRPLLQNVYLAAQAGELTCILGPNGSGKTTLLRCLLGELKPQTGQVELFDKPIGQYKPRQRATQLGYVPQQASCAFPLPVADIIATGRYPHLGQLGLLTREDQAVLDRVMQQTEVTHLADRSLNELSGGEAQRVMIARALAAEPNICLLDEPTSHLDLRHQMQLYDLMRSLAHDSGLAVICVSHDVNQAARFADQLVMLRNGQVVAAGKVAEVLTESTLAETYDVAVQLLPTDSGPPMLRVTEW